MANIILGIMFFLMGLVVLIMFISPMNVFLDIAQQSDNLNCKGYIHGGNVSNVLSFNSTMDGGNSGDPLACLSLKLYLPYILLIFLIGGVSLLIAGKAGDMFGFGENSESNY